MSIASEITRLQGVKSDILQAIADKGVTVPAGSALADCLDLISEISGAGLYIPGTIDIGGQTYATTTFNGKTWIAENLNLITQGMSVNPSGSPTTPTVFYPRDDYRTNYGVLYNFYAVDYIEANKSMLLPDGWRVPTKADYDDLFSYINGISCASKILNSPTFGVGFNALGFNILPAGDHDKSDSSYKYEGTTGYEWCITLDSYNRAYHIDAKASNMTFASMYGDREYGYSLRLIKDI
jgi:uncharacterized protein (TIGR02145 family)